MSRQSYLSDRHQSLKPPSKRYILVYPVISSSYAAIKDLTQIRKTIWSSQGYNVRTVKSRQHYKDPRLLQANGPGLPENPTARLWWKSTEIIRSHKKDTFQATTQGHNPGVAVFRPPGQALSTRKHDSEQGIPSNNVLALHCQ